MKKIYYIISILMIGIIFTSCEDFLDASPSHELTDDSFWGSEQEAKNILTDLYGYTFHPDLEMIVWQEAMSDNSYLRHDWWGGQQQVANGNNSTGGEAPRNAWKSRYRNIRKCWFILENLDKVPFKTKEAEDIMKAEVRALLAYNYHGLVAYFGDVPFPKKTLTVMESRTIGRSNKSEILEFIHAELDAASNTLKSKNMQKGRVTWGMCIALKARAYLYENNYTKVLEMTELLKNAGYSLHTAGSTPYEDLFNGLAEDSKEIIFAINALPKSGALSAGHGANIGMLIKQVAAGDPYCGIFPTGSLVDAYPMADGRLLKEAGSTYDPKQPYLNRDPRFYQSIIYPTQQMKYFDNATKTIKTRLYDPEDNTTPALQLYTANEPSATGYVWNKYIDWSEHGMLNVGDCQNDLILFRYADVLLMEAEALLETKGMAAKTEIIANIDQLRTRVGGGTVNAANYGTIDALRKLVHNERRIELANEGLRYFDLIRWKEAELDNLQTGVGLVGTLYGAMMRQDPGSPGDKDKTILVDGVKRRWVEERRFDAKKDYLFPIPQDERDLNSNLTQNPNW